MQAAIHRFQVQEMMKSSRLFDMELFDHQRKAVEELRSGSILCGGVGSGKSRTAIAYYFCVVCGGECDGVYKPMVNPINLYIITTARKRDTLEWDEELIPFFLSRDKESPKIVVDSWNNIKKYVEVKDAFFIFDEQRVVGSGSWVKSFLAITKMNKWILLSATPGDTWMDYIPVFIANGFYKNRTEFIHRHVVPDYRSKYFRVERYLEEGRLIKLRNYLLVNMTRVKETIQHHEYVLATYDKSQYKSIMKNRWNPYTGEPIANVSELGYVIRRVVNSDPSRVVEIKKILEKHNRVIIFYNFDFELEILLSMHLDDLIDVAQWNGHKHEPLPKSKKWIYLVQYTAGAEGWNCTKTNAMIFYSQNYSYKITEQASGRIDRLNTPYTDLYYYHLKSNAPIDMAIYRCLKKKQQFNESRYFHF